MVPQFGGQSLERASSAVQYNRFDLDLCPQSLCFGRLSNPLGEVFPFNPFCSLQNQQFGSAIGLQPDAIDWYPALAGGRVFPKRRRCRDVRLSNAQRSSFWLFIFPALGGLGDVDQRIPRSFPRLRFHAQATPQTPKANFNASLLLNIAFLLLNLANFSVFKL